VEIFFFLTTFSPYFPTPNPHFRSLLPEPPFTRQLANNNNKLLVSLISKELFHEHNTNKDEKIILSTPNFSSDKSCWVRLCEIIYLTK
jgi:hypothetical protein